MSDFLEQPADQAAEMAVVGSAMAAGGRVLDEADLVPDDFYRPAHGQLWSLMLAMHLEGEPIDQTSVQSRQLKEMPKLSSWLIELVTNYRYAVPNVGYHAKVVRDAAVRRRLIASCTRIIQDCYGPSEVEQLIDSARSGVDGVMDRVRSGAALPSFAENVADVLADLESKEKERLFPTGWHDLDRMLNGGLRPQHLTVIGARPAVGKSVAAAVAAANLAGRGSRVLIASLEMPRRNVTQRILSNIADVTLDRIINRTVTARDWELLERQVKRSLAWKLVIDDGESQTLTSLRSRARDMQRSGGLDVVIVDYLQLMSGSFSESRQQVVAGIARGLKVMAREFNVPVVAIAQVNRRAGDDMPTMSELRESGEIENSADEVILLHRDDEDTPGLITFKVEKNRYGRTGLVEMAWAPHHARIVSLAEESA